MFTLSDLSPFILLRQRLKTRFRFRGSEHSLSEHTAFMTAEVF
jgi:hypothetical protein